MKSFDKVFYSEVLDKINTNIYVTDVETDEIIYMNEVMKQTFGVKNPEGKVCWKVLQHGMTRRCAFCKINKLLNSEPGEICRWRENNTVTGRTYQNHDSLVEWEGKTYHIQHSVDITEQLQLSEYASIDELTGIWNRRAGKDHLARLLEKQGADDSFIVVMMDVNELKRVNDQLGHLEGDRMLTYVVEVTGTTLKGREFMFRLSGDEFIAVLFNRTMEEAKQWETQVLEKLKDSRARYGITYDVSVSFGMIEVKSDDHYTVSEVFSIADVRMYVNKQKYHLAYDREKKLPEKLNISENFSVNVQLRIDEMCGILNRTAGKEQLSQGISWSREHQKAFTVALLDADNLKGINEDYGISTGDALLVQMVNTVKKRIKRPDFMFRVSGDEFMVVSFRMEEKELSKLMVDCLKDLHSIKERSGLPYEIEFSYGTCTVQPDDSLTVNGIIANADDRMYMQKLRRRKTRMLEARENVRAYSGNSDLRFEYDSTLLYDALRKSTDDFIYLCNMKTGVFRYSPAQVHLFNLPGEIVENPLSVWEKIVHPDDWPRFYKSNMEIGENMMDYHSVEFRAKNRDGEYLWMRCRGQLMRDEFGEPVMFAGIMTQLGRQNKIDPVTQLLNHTEFFRIFEQKIHDKSMVERMNIMILDIDNFKQINEMYDRAFGDNILKSIAQLIQSVLPDNAGLFKLDNDRMGILQENVGPDAAEQIYKKIQHVLAHMYQWKRYNLNITLSAGCVLYPDNGADATELFKYADYTLRFAKEHGKNRLEFFSKDILENRRRALEVQTDLRASINRKFSGFDLYFQPQVDAVSRKLIGAEALLRWKDPSGAFVSPMEFVPILEETGMIISVGQWVLRQSLRTVKPWLLHCPQFSVSVNMSALQVMDPDFVSQVLQIVEEEQFPTKNLVLELTESYSASHMDLLYEKFRLLRARGIRIAMDDFGTGYSSLGLLKFAPVDVVKIDRAFVKDILKSKFDATFIQFVVTICHDVGIRVCLEGMETAEEYDALREMNLDYIQGYLFGKPMPDDAFVRWAQESECSGIFD